MSLVVSTEPLPNPAMWEVSPLGPPSTTAIGQDSATSWPERSISLLGLSCSWWSVRSTWAPAGYPYALGSQPQLLQLTFTPLPSGSSRYVGVWELEVRAQPPALGSAPPSLAHKVLG